MVRRFHTSLDRCITRSKNSLMVRRGSDPVSRESQPKLELSVQLVVRVCRGRRSVASQAATAAWPAVGRFGPTKAGDPTGATDRRAVAGVVTRRSERDHS